MNITQTGFPFSRLTCLVPSTYYKAEMKKEGSLLCGIGKTVTGGFAITVTVFLGTIMHGIGIDLISADKMSVFGFV